uniref:Hemolysin A n=1 Tax=Rhizophora mucronata TaxID=61149 RepID=A0A2P2JRR4_RHIMU
MMSGTDLPSYGLISFVPVDGDLIKMMGTWATRVFFFFYMDKRLAVIHPYAKSQNGIDVCGIMIQVYVRKRF